MGGEGGGGGGVYVVFQLDYMYNSTLRAHKKSVWYMYMYLKIKHGLFLQVRFSFSVCCLHGYHNGCPG